MTEPTEEEIEKKVEKLLAERTPRQLALAYLRIRAREKDLQARLAAQASLLKIYEALGEGLQGGKS
jgi:muconolactone delta-isomerase